MRIIASIPVNVTYFSSPACEVGFSWDGDSDNIISNKITVLPSYCSDSDNSKTLETGEKWAKGYATWCVKTKKYIYDPVTKISRTNEPINGVRIVSLEKRSQGGRAYKVVTKEGYYFDIREDILLDIISNSSITKSVINCDLLWCKIGSEMKLIRVDSDLHKHAIESQEIKNAGPIPANKLIAGRIYENRKGEKLLFLGNCTVDLVIDGSNGNYKYSNSKRQLWYNIPDYKVDSLGDKKKYFKDFIDGSSSSLCSYYYDFTKSKSVFVETDIVTDISLNDIEAHISKYGNSTPYKYKTGTIKIL